MKKAYRNARNNDRHAEVERAALVGEAGEVFTPKSVVEDFLSHELVKVHVKPAAYILEPSAGDGNFLAVILEEVLSQEATLSAIENIYSVEIMADNHKALLERCRKVIEDFLPKVNAAVLSDYLNTHFLLGSYLSERACSLSCSATCISCSPLQLPGKYDLIIGNPPYNPNAVYTAFMNKALEQATTVAYILPTTWLVSPRYSKFRSTIAPHLRSVEKLPWKTFAIKLRTCKVVLSKDSTSQPSLPVTMTTSVDGDFRIADSILKKAFEKWDTTLTSYQSSENCKLFMGWKCNLGRDRGQINYLQSIGFDETSMPNNVFTFFFKTEVERLNYCKYSSSKLAAYLQYCVDSDTVARYLPIPPLDLEDYSDESLYKILALTEDEINTIESFKVFVSARAKMFYDHQGITVRNDAVIGRARNACTSCGSSSFHKKGCVNGTEKEKALRDKV